jgi:hypothetical protein
METNDADVRIFEPELDRPQEDCKVVLARSQLGCHEYHLVGFVDANLPPEAKAVTETFSTGSKGKLEHDGLVETFIRWHANSIVTDVAPSPGPFASISQHQGSGKPAPPPGMT